MTAQTTRRLTVAQALIHALAAQYTEQDGLRQRLIPGVWGIFGHGNVAGVGQALEEYGDQLGLPTFHPQNEQAMVHTASAFARHNNRLATFACTASVGPGSTNMLTGAALATVNRLPVLLLPSDHLRQPHSRPGVAGLEHPTEHDLSVNDCFRPVSKFYTRISRPEQLLVGAARGPAGADRPRRNRRGGHQLAGRRADRELRLARPPFLPSGPGASAGRRPKRRSLGRPPN